MTQANPYSPPKSEVRDGTRVRVLAERPRQIVHAMVLFWVSTVFGALVTFQESQQAQAVGWSSSR